jgi:hypothetical protein
MYSKAGQPVFHHGAIATSRTAFSSITPVFISESRLQRMMNSAMEITRRWAVRAVPPELCYCHGMMLQEGVC